MGVVPREGKGLAKKPSLTASPGDGGPGGSLLRTRWTPGLRPQDRSTVDTGGGWGAVTGCTQAGQHPA